MVSVEGDVGTGWLCDDQGTTKKRRVAKLTM